MKQKVVVSIYVECPECGSDDQCLLTYTKSRGVLPHEKNHIYIEDQNLTGCDCGYTPSDEDHIECAMQHLVKEMNGE